MENCFINENTLFPNCLFLLFPFSCPASAMHWVFSETFLVASFGAWGARHFYKFNSLGKLWNLCNSLLFEDLVADLQICHIQVQDNRRQADGWYLSKGSSQVHINAIFVKFCIAILEWSSSHSPFTERCQWQKHSWLLSKFEFHHCTLNTSISGQQTYKKSRISNNIGIKYIY